MIHIKVDGKNLFKGELGDWEQKPPEVFKQAIQPGRRAEPWLKAVMIILADHVVNPRDLRINVLTRGRAGGWDMTVRYE